MSDEGTNAATDLLTDNLGEIEDLLRQAKSEMGRAQLKVKEVHNKIEKLERKRDEYAEALKALQPAN